MTGMRGGNLADADQRRPALLDIQEGLQADQVGAGIHQRPGLLAVGVLHVVEGDLAQRFDELAGRADGGPHVGPVPGFAAGDLDGTGIDLGQAVLPVRSGPA